MWIIYGVIFLVILGLGIGVLAMKINRGENISKVLWDILKPILAFIWSKIKNFFKQNFILLCNTFMWIWEHLRQLYKYVLLSIFIYVCTPYCDKLISSLFVDNIFEGVNSSTTLDKLMIGYFFLSIIAFYHWFHKKYVVSEEYVFFHTFLIGWYFYFRNCSGLSFEFIMFEWKAIKPFLAYLDVIFAFPAIALYMLFYFQKKSELKPATGIVIEESDLFSEDFLNSKDIVEKHPLNVIKENANSNLNFAEDLCSKIYSVSSKDAFAVAVLGRWGAGKSHFLNLVKNTFKESYTKEVEVVEFFPWKNKGEEAIIKDFFALLINQLAKYNGNLAPQVNAYIDALLEPGKKWETRLLRLLLLGGLMPKNTESEYKKLKKAIVDIDKKIIVIIDDLDRLEGEEILGVLKLIRNVANFEKLIFVAAYDREYINRAIESSLHEFDCNSYLEKIFQLEVSIPVYDSLSLATILVTLIEYQFKDIFVSDENRKVKESIIENEEGIIWNYLLNVRDLIRFTNLLILDLKNAIQKTNEQEVWDICLSDFLWTRFLKLKFPTCYLFLYEKRNVIFDLKEDGHYFSLKTSKEAEEEYHFEKLIKENKLIPISSFEIVSNTIKLLLKSESDYDDELNDFKNDNPLGFSNTWAFYKYFSNKAFVGKYSKDNIITLFNLTPDKITIRLNDWVAQSPSKIDRFHALLLGVDLTMYFKKKDDYETIMGNLAPTSIIEQNGKRKELLEFYLLRDEITKHFYEGKHALHKKFVTSLFETLKLTLKSLGDLIKGKQDYKIYKNEEFKELYSSIIIQKLSERNPQGVLSYIRKIKGLLDDNLINKDNAALKSRFKEEILIYFDEFLKTLVTFHKGSNFDVVLRERIITYLFGDINYFVKYYEKLVQKNGVHDNLIREIFFDVLIKKWLFPNKKSIAVTFWSTSIFREDRSDYPVYLYFPNKEVKDKKLTAKERTAKEHKEVINGLFLDKASILFPKYSQALRLKWNPDSRDENVGEECYLAIPVHDVKINIELSYEFSDESAPPQNTDKYIIHESKNVNLDKLGLSKLTSHNLQYKVYFFDLMNGTLEINFNRDDVRDFDKNL